MPNVSIGELLDALFQRGGSDLVLSVGAPPSLRIDGRLVRYNEERLTAPDTEALVRELLAPQQRLVFAEQNSVDFSFEWGQHGRIRGNAFRQRGTVAVSLRAIPDHIPSFAALLLPASVAALSNAPHGLILLTGPTGAGTSTTHASLIDDINVNRACHVITIED